MCGYTCKGTCQTHPRRVRWRGRYLKDVNGVHSHYMENVMWCKNCDVYVNRTGMTNRCPCCGIKMRMNPRKKTPEYAEAIVAPTRIE